MEIDNAEANKAEETESLHPLQWLLTSVAFLFFAYIAAMRNDHVLVGILAAVILGTFAGAISLMLRTGASSYLGLTVPLLWTAYYKTVEPTPAGGAAWACLYLGVWHLVLGVGAWLLARSVSESQ